MDMYYNYILLTACLAWWVAQAIKFVINLIKYKQLNFERLIGAGGWPSAHSAMVCSASVAVLRTEGLNSTAFAIVCIFSLITMYDAMGVRRAAGQQAKEINLINRRVVTFNDLTQAMSSEKPIEEIAKLADENAKALKEFIGHTPFEVVSGAILGIIFAFIMPQSL
ncbi:MAG: divergent PAP2 family protein [Oscillospiraceae bacterium]|nr:divergent PAP2 family protein [Oscillospiraceae bacterium]MBR4345819.1 divergent PAP2 family protein [Oscillospiraceae bacterium]